MDSLTVVRLGGKMRVSYSPTERGNLRWHDVTEADGFTTHRLARKERAIGSSDALAVPIVSPIGAPGMSPATSANT
jgi:hypothetical protein